MLFRVLLRILSRISTDKVIEVLHQLLAHFLDKKAEQPNANLHSTASSEQVKRDESDKTSEPVKEDNLSVQSVEVVDSINVTDSVLVENNNGTTNESN
jgi:hypothetical protein